MFEDERRLRLTLHGCSLEHEVRAKITNHIQTHNVAEVEATTV